jgi:hypothetical protein
MWGRLGVLALAATLAGCSSGDADEQAATTTTTKSTTRAGTTTEASSAQGGGLLDALGSLFGGNEITRCVDGVADSSGGSRTTTLPAIAREVQRLRHLRFKKIPRPRYLKPGVLARRIRAEIAAYPAVEAAADGQALIALGALPKGTNLKALLRRALAGQVAGFYDPRTGELVVASDPKGGLDPVERITLAHELDHALTDQTLDFPRYLEAELPRQGLEDAALAGLAVIEGDATLLMQAYAAENLSLGDAFRSLGAAFGSQGDFEELPYYLQASSIFPYLEGLEFVCKLYDRGGWKAVNRAYRKPPTTTAQVLFPERYFAREPAADLPRPVQPPGPGWNELDRNAVGAADLLWLFEAPGGETARALSDPLDRAAAWAGGELRVWGRGKSRAVTLTLVERRGERDLCASMRAWFKAGERRGFVRCSGRVIRANLHP